MSAAGFKVVRWASQQAPTVRRPDGKADTVAHLVLVCLAVYADGNGHARPGVATLADDARLTTRATADALARLDHTGLIDRAQELTGGTVVWRLNLSAQRGDEERHDAQQRHELARRKHAERSRRYRARKAVRDAEVERDVTPNLSVTNVSVTPNLDARDAEVERTSRSTSTHVTPPTPSQPQVTPATTSRELPMNCQRTAKPIDPAQPPHAHEREHETDAVITAIRLRTGKTITPGWAAHVIEHLLGNRTDIASRTGYLIAAIRKEPNPQQRFLPAPQPPPFRKDTPA